MQFMQMLKANLFTRRAIALQVIALAAIAGLAIFAHQNGSNPALATVCENPPVVATFNPWPLMYGNNRIDCHDLPAIDASIVHGTQAEGYSQNAQDWADGLQMTPGQEGVALMYLHNGAANNLDPNQTVARDVKVTTVTDTTVGTDHNIKVTYTGKTAAGADMTPHTKTFVVHTPANSHLEVLPNSGFMYTYAGQPILSRQNLNIGNSTYTVGDVDACFEYSLFLSFRFKVVQNVASNATLSITKQVRKVDSNRGPIGNYSSSVNVEPNDRVEYRVAVTNTSNTVADTVTMSDSGAAGVTIDPGSTTVGVSDDALLANNLWSGSMPGTVNLGSLQPGESRIIKYTAHATDRCKTVVNTAHAQASNAAAVSATASVVIGGCTTGNPGLSIQKLVQNARSAAAGYVKSVTVNTGDSVIFKVILTNTGNATLNNARISDPIPAGLQFNDSVVGDGTASFNNNTLSVNFGSIAPGQSKSIQFTAIVTATTADFDRQICNIATGSGDGVPSVNDNACVNITHIIHNNPNISIKKYVKNTSGSTSYNDSSVDARSGDRVMFKVTVSNPGSSTLSNVHMTDSIPSGLKFDDSVTGDGTANFNNTTFTVDFGSISAGSSKTVEFAARVQTDSNTTICNTASATGNNVGEVRDDACVNVKHQGSTGNPNIVLSKRAWNDTKNVDATTVNAARGDFITYTLVTTNNGNADATNYVISDDLSQVLPLADMIDVNGGSVSNNSITYPAMTIRSGETIVKTFRVRIKSSLAPNLSYQLRNTYGNTVVINVPGQGVFEAPKTGAAGTSAAVFAGLLTAGFIAVRKGRSILGFIFA